MTHFKQTLAAPMSAFGRQLDTRYEGAANPRLGPGERRPARANLAPVRKPVAA